MEIPECRLDLFSFVFSVELSLVDTALYGNIFPSLVVSDIGYCWTTAGTPDRRLQCDILFIIE